MHVANKATRIRLSDFHTPQMRAFHVTWFAFFLAFFGWFGIAPLMAVVREDLGLSKTQIGNTIIASVAITVLVRLLMGYLCDRIGPRRAYSGLLVLGSLPVMAIGLADSYEAFLLARLAIGAIGASFVITQYHTSAMFAPNCVGTANATTAGWGNMGAGVTHMVMPLLLALLVSLGVDEFAGWRLAMVVPGVSLFLCGLAYARLTQDLPDGNFDELRARGELAGKEQNKGAFREAATDARVWVLFVCYGACFGVELTINNIAALHYIDHFGLDLTTAGLIAGLFGLMNLFARTMGGYSGDRYGVKYGLRGRVTFLGAILLAEGLSLALFSQMETLWPAVAVMMLFGLLVKMSSGATFAVVPFVNRRALGAVSGIVGAGGNAGAVAAGFLFRSETLPTQDALLYLGLFVAAASLLTFTVRFSPQAEAEARSVYEKAAEQPAT